MSLITRCPACGTMFKVVTDQLKVSQGWVRCGHCSDVFDAQAYLVPANEITSAAVPSSPDSLPTPLSPLPVAHEAMVQKEAITASPAADASLSPPEAATTLVQRPTETVQAVPEATSAPEPVVRLRFPVWTWANGRRPDVQDSAFDFDPASWKRAQEAQPQEVTATEMETPRLSMPSAETSTPPALPEASRPLETRATAREISLDASDEPSDLAELAWVPDHEEVSFVRQARRKAFWRKPVVRGLMSLLALLLLLALALQWALQHKDRLAAMEPRLVPAFQLVCPYLNCQLRPPRQIEALVIDSSSFNNVGPDTFRLSFILKNTGMLRLEMPALEVTLTDTQDKAVVRRILSPSEFGATSATLAAHAEMAGLVTLSVASDGDPAAASSPTLAEPLPVAGYRVLAFYP